MIKRISLPVATYPQDAHELGSFEQERRRFITRILGGSLMLVTPPALASTLFKR